MAKTYKELAAEALEIKSVADISICFNKTVKPSNLDTNIYVSFNSETVDTVETFNEKINKNIKKTPEELLSEHVTIRVPKFFQDLVFKKKPD